MRARLGGVLAVLATVILAIGAAWPEAAYATFPGKNGKIAFYTNRDGNHEIYVMNPDGSNPTRLTNDLAADLAPAWSPDGTKIAFSSDRDGNVEIYVMDADGSNPTQLTNNTVTEVNGAPAWSPDGTKIVFQRAAAPGFPSVRQIWVMNADGSNQTNLSNSSTADEAPAWSPDGAKIAFSRGDPPGSVGEVWVMNADGSNQTILTPDFFPYNTGGPDWSPDGTKIAFYSTFPNNPSYEIWVMDADGSHKIQLTGDGVPPNNVANANPRWSPDGTKIKFLSNRDGNLDTYVMDADGSNPTNITPINNGADDVATSWQASSDADGDGIFDEVDEQPLVTSRRFSDVARGGSTAGSFFGGTPGTVQVVDHPNPAKGVRVVVTTGAVDPFFFSLDFKGSVLVLGPGTYTITDPEAVITVEVEQGGPAEVEIVVGGVPLVIEIDEGEEATITETDTDGNGTVDNVVVTPLVGEITVNGAPIGPGGLNLGTLLNTRLEIEGKRSFELRTVLVSGAVDPLTKPVSLRVGTFLTTIPPGAFVLRRGTYRFTGVIGGVRLAVSIVPLRGGGRYAVEAEVKRANLAGTVNPVPVQITIGDESGTAAVQATMR